MRWLVIILFGFSMYCRAETVAEPVTSEGCQEPEMLLIPNGHKASSAEMLQAQHDVEDYIEHTQAFLTCLLAAEETKGDALTLEQKRDSIMRYNLAVARLEGLVESFNQQLQAYKKTNAN